MTTERPAAARSEAEELAVQAARVADAAHGAEIAVIDVGAVLGVTDYFVIVSASNRRLVRALVEEIEERLREIAGRAPLRVEGAREQQWVLIDYGDIVVHVFLTETRDFYEIERLYSDVPRIDWAAEPPAGQL